MTNNFPHMGKITQGRDFNFYQKATITATTFGGATIDGYQPDMVITFPTYTVTFHLESGGPLYYSFNGNTVHGEMIVGKSSQDLTFINRVISPIWFKATTTALVRVEAWGIR